MPRPLAPHVSLVAPIVSLFVLAACSNTGSATPADAGSGDGACTPAETPIINFAAYSTPREVYGKIIPAFVSQWKEDHDDQNVIFQESYAGSTTQAANVIAGYEADVVALSLGPDVDQIADAGLITHDWTDTADGGMVSTSVVVFDVRPGNPDGLTDWDDLTADGVEILTPDPASSGGARWNLVSAWGAALRGYAGVAEGDAAGRPGAARGHPRQRGRVRQERARLDPELRVRATATSRSPTRTRCSTAQDAGLEDEAVYPPSSVLIENPVAVVDANVDKHCVREVAEAFVEYLHTPEVKELYTDVGFLRSTDLAEAQDGGGQFPKIEDLWDVDELGGWEALTDELFADDGIVTQAIAG